jgi:hypothetical protein
MEVKPDPYSNPSAMSNNVVVSTFILDKRGHNNEWDQEKMAPMKRDRRFRRHFVATIHSNTYSFWTVFLGDMAPYGFSSL